MKVPYNTPSAVFSKVLVNYPLVGYKIPLLYHVSIQKEEKWNRITSMKKRNRIEQNNRLKENRIKKIRGHCTWLGLALFQKTLV